MLVVCSSVEDNTAGGFLFHEPGDVIDYVVQNTIPMNTDIVIPPGDSNYMATHEHTIQEDILLLALGPSFSLSRKSRLA